MKDCTCVGTCKGAAGLGSGWKCALESAPPQQDVTMVARQVLAMTAKQHKPNTALIRLAQAVVDAAGCRIEDYRSGYSAGYSHARNAEPMNDKASAERFFGYVAATD